MSENPKPTRAEAEANRDWLLMIFKGTESGRALLRDIMQKAIDAEYGPSTTVVRNGGGNA